MIAFSPRASAWAMRNVGPSMSSAVICPGLRRRKLR
jgi:hypothetical protein